MDTPGEEWGNRWSFWEAPQHTGKTQAPEPQRWWPAGSGKVTGGGPKGPMCVFPFSVYVLTGIRGTC